MAATKIRWGDTLDEDDSLPSNSIVGPDKSGVITKTTYSKNDKGDIVKTVVKTRVSKVEKKIYAVSISFLWSCQPYNQPFPNIHIVVQSATTVSLPSIQLLHACCAGCSSKETEAQAVWACCERASRRQCNSERDGRHPI